MPWSHPTTTTLPGAVFRHAYWEPSDGAAQSAAQQAAAAYGQAGIFGRTLGDMFGNYANNVGQQGANYVNNNAQYTAGLGGLGNNLTAGFGKHYDTLGGMFDSLSRSNATLGASMAPLAGQIGNVYGEQAQALSNLGPAYTGNLNAFISGNSALANSIADTYRSNSATAPGIANAAAQNMDAYSQGLTGLNSAYAGGMNSYMQGLGSLRNSDASALGAFASGIGGLNNATASAFGAMAGVPASMANAYGAYAQGLGSLGGSLAQNYGYLTQGLGNASAAMSSEAAARNSALANLYGGMSTGMGNVATAMANERSNIAAAQAMAEAARQGTVGNLGSAALAGYGSAIGSTMGAWAQDQAARANALANMQGANQAAVSGLGQSQNTSLANLGKAYSVLGLGGALGGLMGGSVPGGSSFRATGPDGEIASGSFSAPSIGGGGGSVGPISTSGLDAIRGDIKANPAMAQLGSANDAAMGRLDRMGTFNPTDLLPTLHSNMTAMADKGYGQSGAGMDQFYGQVNRPSDFTSILGALNSNFVDASSQIRGSASDYGSVMDRMQAGFANTGNTLSGMRGDLGGGFAATRGDLNNALGGLLGAYGPTLDAMDRNAAPLGSAFDRYLAGTAGVADAMGNAFGALGSMTGSSMDRLGGAYGTSTQTINDSLASNNANLNSVLAQLNQTTTGNRDAFDVANRNVGGLAGDINKSGSGAAGAIGGIQGAISGAIGANQSAYGDLMKLLTEPGKNNAYQNFRQDIFGLGGSMADAYNRGNEGIGDVMGTLGSGYNSATNDVLDLWNNTMGRTPYFPNPERDAMERRNVDLFNRRAELEDQLWRNSNPGLAYYAPFRTPEDLERAIGTMPSRLTRDFDRPGPDVADRGRPTRIGPNGEIEFGGFPTLFPGAAGPKNIPRPTMGGGFAGLPAPPTFIPTPGRAIPIA